MKIAIVDESAARASIIEEGLAEFDDREVYILTERQGLLARIEEIGPDIVLMDLGNPSRDLLPLAAKTAVGDGPALLLIGEAIGAAAKTQNRASLQRADFDPQQ